jgi:glutamate synthase (NADPH/NADH) small chain
LLYTLSQKTCTMDQRELRELEDRCIQEDAPECTAACPLHVDARAFVGLMMRDQWEDARRVLHKTMPLPSILGRICDAPCQKKCLRGKVGDPIQIGALERVCVTLTEQEQRVQSLPGRDKKVAVVGSGLSSLTAAHDLARKGYAVTLFEPTDELGGRLLEIHEALLPREVIQDQIALLTRFKVDIRLNAPTPSSKAHEGLLREFNALYFGLDGRFTAEWHASGFDRISVHPLKQTTEQEGLFAGGMRRPDGNSSPVWEAAEGRWAATSIDRFLQKVSLTAGRETDGPYTTRLYTSLEGITPLPAVPKRGEEYTRQGALDEARRCLQCQCLECVKVCTYLERFGAYPKRYAREIYNNESIVMGTRAANKLINSCSLCGLCEEVCPNDFAMQDLCLEARRSMVRRGKMPLSAHEFTLLDMEFSRSDRFALVRHQPGHKASTHIFFPGCQLCASAPGQVRRVYDYLCRSSAGGTGLILACCGAPACWAGEEPSFQKEVDAFRDKWISLGRPKVILACSTCYKMFKQNLREIPILSLWKVLEEIELPEGERQTSSVPLAVHDPCTTRREPEIQQSIRKLLKRLNNLVEELRLSRENTECCGFGGLMQDANPALAREVVARRAAESPLDYVTYCAVCRDNLAAAGKRTLHLLDLIFPDPSEKDPASRKRPGWSQRQENRARLKAELLTELWGEKGAEMDKDRKIMLHVAPEVQALLEERRILIEDLQKVIHHAETTGAKLVHPKTGHFKASFKPYKVTFWVEYSLSGEGYIVHNAYTHRMDVSGGTPS